MRKECDDARSGSRGGSALAHEVGQVCCSDPRKEFGAVRTSGGGQLKETGQGGLRGERRCQFKSSAVCTANRTVGDKAPAVASQYSRTMRSRRPQAAYRPCGKRAAIEDQREPPLFARIRRRSIIIISGAETASLAVRVPAVSWDRDSRSGGANLHSQYAACGSCLEPPPESGRLQTGRTLRKENRCPLHVPRRNSMWDLERYSRGRATCPANTKRLRFHTRAPLRRLARHARRTRRGLRSARRWCRGRRARADAESGGNTRVAERGQHCHAARFPRDHHGARHRRTWRRS